MTYNRYYYSFSRAYIYIYTHTRHIYDMRRIILFLTSKIEFVFTSCDLCVLQEIPVDRIQSVFIMCTETIPV